MRERRKRFEIDSGTYHRCRIFAEQNTQTIFGLRGLAFQIGCDGLRCGEARLCAVDIDRRGGTVAKAALREIQKTLADTDGALRDPQLLIERDQVEVGSCCIADQTRRHAVARVFGRKEI